MSDSQKMRHRYRFRPVSVESAGARKLNLRELSRVIRLTSSELVARVIK